MSARTLAAAALVALVGTALAQPKQPEPLPPPKAEKPDIPKLLAARVTVEKFEGKFRDAVKMLAEKYDLPLVIDPRLGEGAGAMECDAPADDAPVKLPKMVNARLDTVLRLLAEQVHGKVMAYPDYVRIAPDIPADYESGALPVSADPNEEPPLLPQNELVRNRPLIKRALVNASFKAKPLSEALDEIAESTGATVALSPLLPVNVRQAPITARFANTPVDAAVRTLCEMTACGVIEDANVLLVTTRECAAARAQEEAAKAKAKQQPGVAVGLGGVLVPADPTGDIAKLKEQNEQLRQQLGEIQKQLRKITEK